MFNILAQKSIHYPYKHLQKLFVAGLLVISAFLHTTFAANISFSPSTGSYTVGQSITVGVLVTNNQDSINAVSGNIAFPTDLLEITSVSKTGIITMWAEEPTYSNTNGVSGFEGVILNPGYSEPTGRVVTVTFVTKKAGNATVVLKSGSVLANDGNATNVLGTLGSATFTIAEKEAKKPEIIQPVVGVTPVVTSLSYPDHLKWYNGVNADFSWTVPTGVNSVRTLYDTQPTSNPSKVYTPPITTKQFTVSDDGVQYFHVQFKNGNEWGTTAHYKFMIDTVAPEKVTATLPNGTTSSSPSPQVVITASDALSGIDHYTIGVDTAKPTVFSIVENNTYSIPDSSTGEHIVHISAFDKAGNEATTTLSFTITSIEVPVITSYTKNIETNSIFSVRGTTYPDSVVEIVLIDQEGKTISEKVTSDGAGIFSYNRTESLPKGIYELKARVINVSRAMSSFSPSNIVIVEHMPLLKVGMFVMNWLSLVLMIILALAAVLFTLWFSFVQFSRFRRKVKRTMQEAENALKTNVAALRRDTEEFHTILVKAEKKRDLTKEEQTILKKFKKRLDTTEKEIEKKLEQIR